MTQNLKNAELTSRKCAATPKGVGVLAPFYADRAVNSELWDVEGNRYIDFASGIAVLNVGHSHPKIISAVEAQLRRFTHTAFQVVPYEAYVRLAERLCKLTPGKYPKKAAFFSTGAEAVENAIKVARAATGRPGVIAFSGAFHGRTLLGLALTGKVSPYKLRFGPFPPEIFHAPFPSEVTGVSASASLAAIEQLFKCDIDPKRVAAIIFEPVQGEGGFYSAPKEWVNSLRALCDQHGILMIADEVQTGFGRTGRMFAMEHYDVDADILTVAKSLAAGLPLSGIVGKAELLDAADSGGLGGTYAGNPLAVAAAHAVLDVMDEEQLPDRAERLGAQLRDFLSSLKPKLPQLREVRGLGSMVAAEFFTADGKAPDGSFAQRVQAAAMGRGLLLLTCGPYGNVIRFLYPLTIQTQIFEEALNTLESVLFEVAGA